MTLNQHVEFDLLRCENIQKNKYFSLFCMFFGSELDCIYFLNILTTWLTPHFLTPLKVESYFYYVTFYLVLQPNNIQVQHFPLLWPHEVTKPQKKIQINKETTAKGSATVRLNANMHLKTGMNFSCRTGGWKQNPGPRRQETRAQKASCSKKPTLTGTRYSVQTQTQSQQP